MGHPNAVVIGESPLDFLRDVRAHAQMLEEAARYVPPKGSVLDPGCGIGLLTEHLPQQEVTYSGLDASPEFIRICSARYGNRAGFSFRVADINAARFESESYDVVTLLNTLNLPGIHAVEVLKKAYDALRSGGRVVVSGPTHPESFGRAEASILAQLERDGKRAGNEARYRAFRDAQAGLPENSGHYWSLEGMVALLTHLGFGSIVAANNALFYGSVCMVVAAKGAPRA